MPWSWGCVRDGRSPLPVALGGLRRAVIAGAFALFIAFTGQWEQAMITVYLCGISVSSPR